MTDKNIETLAITTAERLNNFQAEYYQDRKDLNKKLNGNLERIYQKMENMEQKINTRLPLWTTLLFSLMSALIVGLVVGAVK